MKGRGKWLLALAIGVVALGLVGSTTLAAGPKPASTDWVGWGAAQCAGLGPGLGGLHLPAIAKVLGATTDQLVAEVRAGKTIADIAKAKGVSEDAVVEAALGPMKEMLQIRVKYGQIAQEQADQIQQRLTTQLRERLSQPAPTPGTDAGRQFGGRWGHGGMMGGWAR